MVRTPRIRRARHGLTTVEVALTLGIVLTLLLGICDYGRYVMIKNLADNAVREGARYAVVNTNNPDLLNITLPAYLQTYTYNYLAGISGNKMDFNHLNFQAFQANPVTGANVGPWNTAAVGVPIAVQLDFDFQPTSPLVMPGKFQMLHVTSRVMMLSEAN